MKKVIALIIILLLSLNCSYANNDPQWQIQEKIRLEKINTLKIESDRLLKEQIGKDPQWFEKNKAREERINSLIKESQRLKREQMNSAANATYNKTAQGIDKMKLQHLNLFNSMKNCQPATVQTISGKLYVLGIRNGSCNFRDDIGTTKYRLCQFPLPVARRYAEEAIKSINTGVESTYIQSVTNERYCKIYNK